MWEDNNPLSYEEESEISPHFAPYEDDMSSPPASRDSDEAPNYGFGGDRTPSVHSYSSRRRGDDDDEEDEEYRRSRRERGYSSRIEQMLLENKNVPIVIADAGKNNEGSGGYIVYTIRTGVCKAPQIVMAG